MIRELRRLGVCLAWEGGAKKRHCGISNNLFFKNFSLDGMLTDTTRVGDMAWPPVGADKSRACRERF